LIFNIRHQMHITINANNEYALLWIFFSVWMRNIIQQFSLLYIKDNILKGNSALCD